MTERSTPKIIVRAALKAATLAFVAVVAGVIGAALGRNFGTSNYTVSYADFISVMLSAVTLMVTLLGFFVAILAYVGWREFTDRVDRRADARAADFLEHGFKEGNPLHDMLVTQARKATFRGVHAIEPSLDEALEEELPGEDQ